MPPLAVENLPKKKAGRGITCRKLKPETAQPRGLYSTNPEEAEHATHQSLVRWGQGGTDPPTSPTRERKLPTMAGPPDAAAMKQRIISYMNADRADSLEDYLKFYNKITPASKSAKMVDVNLNSVSIEYHDASGTTHTSIVKIDPPMASLGDARARLVAMAEEATGKPFHQPPDLPSPTPVHVVPEIPVKPLVWTPPEWPGLISLAAICFGFWALHHPYPLSPEGPLQAYLPAFLVEFGRKFREQLFAMMIGIHVIEAISNAKTCFEQGSSIPVVIIWTINGFFEGGPSMLRLSRLVENRTKFDGWSQGNLG